MIAIETFYIVTRGGVYLMPSDGFGGVRWTYNLAEAAKLRRTDANNQARFLEGRVERVDISTCTMGLHWETETRLLEQWGATCEQVTAWVLYDGPDEVGLFTREPDNVGMYWPWEFPVNLPCFPTLQEAKNAAEVAIMETWL